MKKFTIPAPTDNVVELTRLAAQLTVAASSLMPRTENEDQAVESALRLYQRMYDMLEQAVAAKE